MGGIVEVQGFSMDLQQRRDMIVELVGLETNYRNFRDRSDEVMEEADRIVQEFQLVPQHDDRLDSVLASEDIEFGYAASVGMETLKQFQQLPGGHKRGPNRAMDTFDNVPSVPETGNILAREIGPRTFLRDHFKSHQGLSSAPVGTPKGRTKSLAMNLEPVEETHAIFETVSRSSDFVQANPVEVPELMTPERSDPGNPFKLKAGGSPAQTRLSQGWSEMKGTPTKTVPLKTLSRHERNTFRKMAGKLRDSIDDIQSLDEYYKIQAKASQLVPAHFQRGTFQRAYENRKAIKTLQGSKIPFEELEASTVFNLFVRVADDLEKKRQDLEEDRY